MTTIPKHTIADLDAPREQLERELAEMRAAAVDLARRIRLGQQAEQRHLLHDADPDSTVPPFVDLAKGTPGRAL